MNMLMHIDIDFFRRGFRNRLIPFNLDVYEYFPDKFDKRNKVKHDDFSADIIDISYSTARTLCSYHLSEKELYFDIIASLMSNLNFIDPNKTNLLLSESRYKRLRDFSKSTRVGEMAQGINTLFVGSRLNFPYIIDFDLAKNKTLAFLNIQTNGKSPDFVVLDSSLNKIGFFESKGNMNGNVTADLNKATNQINSITNPPCIDYKIPVCTKFQNNNDFIKKILRKVRKSSINYALIEKTCSKTTDTGLLKKLHYASWFYLVGDFTRVESILSDGTVTPILEANDPIYVLDTETDKKNPIYWVDQPLNFGLFSQEYQSELHLFITSRYMYKGQFKIGFYKKIADSLTNNSNEVFQLPEGNINYLKKYPDGTLLYIKNDN